MLNRQRIRHLTEDVLIIVKNVYINRISKNLTGNESSRLEEEEDAVAQDENFIEQENITKKVNVKEDKL